MKVLLVNPSYREVYSKVGKSGGIVAPLGLAYLAALLRENNITVEILDAHALGLSLGELERSLCGYDIVGVPSFTSSLHSSLKVLELAKKNNPACNCVIGGPHISALPVQTMKLHPQIDFGVIGEGEYTFLELVEALQTGSSYKNIRGIVYRQDSEVKLTPARDVIEDIDRLPFPAYDLLPVEKYNPPIHQISFSEDIPAKPYLLLLSSRGCPYDCSFCASQVIWRKKLRLRSAANVLSEIDNLVTKFGVKTVNITDDHFMLDKNRLDEILAGLIKRRYDFHFSCLSRIDAVSKETLGKLKTAGCYLIRYGVESGNQKMLARMHKDLSLSQIEQAFNYTRGVGLSSSASFIIGYPGETRQSFADTIKLARRIRPRIALFFIAIPFPGTELYNVAKSKNLIVDRDYRNWKLLPDVPPVRTEELSSADLQKLRRKAYRQFYFYPAYILERIKEIKSFTQVKLYFKGLLSLSGLINNETN
ncbi:B12-binding domain-containing radical SAM protein [Candidatus Omnitrophota bacterium]